MAVNPGELLAVLDDRNVPGPHVSDEVAVSLVLGVELGERVALVVGADLDSGEVVLATDHDHTTDDTVVVDTVHTSSAEHVLAGSLKTVEETTNLVGSHEGHAELLVVLEVNTPQRPLLRVVVLPEPRKRNLASVLVGVHTLPVLEVEARGRQSSERVLGLLRLGLRSSGGGSGSGSGSSLRLLLLLRGSVLDDLLSEDGVGDNSLEGGLVNDGVVPSGDSRVLAAPLLVQDSRESAGEQRGSEEVSQSDTVTNKVGVGSQVVLENGNALQRALGGIIDVLLVVVVQAQEGTVPATEVREDLSVGVGQPTQDGGVVLLGLTQKGGLLVLGGH